MFENLLILLCLSALGFYWWDSAGAREVAVRVGRTRCQEADVQFLDETVVQKKIWLRRNAIGQRQIARLFAFEFTSDGEDRYGGSILLVGRSLLEFNMDAYRISS